MGHQTATPVTDIFRRIIREEFPSDSDSEEINMSQSQTQNQNNTADAKKPADAPQGNNANTAGVNNEVRKNIAELLFRASSNAGTPEFERDTKILMDAIDNARIKVELPSWRETAKSAAIYGGVTALCLLGTVVVVRLIYGGDGGASN